MKLKCTRNVPTLQLLEMYPRNNINAHVAGEKINKVKCTRNVPTLNGTQEMYTPKNYLKFTPFIPNREKGKVENVFELNFEIL